ncbi:hypothetical protein M011DRAFT_470740 [Sporormia fimetaria CBS 119925]|uniref:Haloacid dehalogenase-like hydrolase n=1 Tax=Sporormia fimetaria CBS 119925 TaxID=1340428 RepID=A0A6A6V4G3_9PLEO|nr:hypothetical protein M011DRAFT_470740 [Sporormia fimetaria CBS 119925]
MRSRLARLCTNAAMSAFNPCKPIHWILDWDGTLTKGDTLDALVRIARKAKPESNVDEAWNRIVAAYLADYDATLKQLAPEGCLPSDVHEERKLLSDMAKVEQRSINRVSASGIFEGLTWDIVECGAKEALRSGEVQLRAGAEAFLRHVGAREDPHTRVLDEVDVLSVNWSACFIMYCLSAGLTEGRKSFLFPFPNEKGVRRRAPFGTMRSRNAQHLRTSQRGSLAEGRGLLMSIYSNELQGISRDEVSTGELCDGDSPIVISSPDKLGQLHDMRRLHPCSLKPMQVAYVGDSRTDFECLLAADLGVCIRDDPMTSSQRALKDSLGRLRIRCPHIQDHVDCDEWGVVWVRDFVELKDWMEANTT